MSRLSSSGNTGLSGAALKAMFSPESSDDLITLLTIYDSVNTSNVVARLCDGFTQRIIENDNDILYGVIKNNSLGQPEPYYFLPMQIVLPGEQEAQAPRASLAIYDVTRYATPLIRNLTRPPRVKMELVLTSTPNTVEVSFDYLYISSITYNKDVINCELTMINLDREPFPVHSFTPTHFPGLF